MLKIFESRNKRISDLIKLGDYLGYSIRENVQLFSADGADGTVTYLTESNKIISGNYSINNNNYILENIRIQDSEVFTNDEKFDNGVTNQVSLFLENLHNDDYTNAENTFSDVIEILTSRTHYQTISEKLQKKSDLFSKSRSILETTEFNRFTEVIPELVKFLAENKEQIQSQVPEIINSLKLSEAVSNAFDISMIPLEELEDSCRFTFVDNSKKSIYEMICKQELVKKELLEAKNSFDLVWASHPVIDSLTNKIFASDEEIEEVLIEAIKELPYITLVSKKKLFETFSRNLGHSTEHISEKDLKNFSSKLFEMKKDAREQLTHLLSEKYGVNLQYLKESPSYKSLINTQVVLFESLGRITPKNSILRQVLSEFSSELKNKDGIQSIDVNNVIQQIFQHAGYSQEEYPLMESFSFNDVKKAFEKIDILIERDEKEDATEGDEESYNSEEEGTDGDEKGVRKKEDESAEEEENDGEEDEADSGEVREEEVEGEESTNIMSDEEVIKAIKDLSDVMNGLDTDDDQKENQ